MARHYRGVVKDTFLDSLSGDELFALDLLATSKFFEDQDKELQKHRREAEQKAKFGDIEIWDEDPDEEEAYIQEAIERDRLDRLRQERERGKEKQQ